MSDEAPLSRVGFAAAPDGLDLRLRSGWFADLIKSDLNPRWFEWASRGFLFHYSTAVGGIAMAAAGNNQPTLWNPTGSGKLFVPLRVLLGYVSTTSAAFHFAWNQLSNAGSQAATASPILTWTDLTPQNGLIGFGKKPAIRFSVACTFTTAPSYLGPTGLSTVAMTAAGTNPPFPMGWDEDGSIVVPPGSAIQLSASGAMLMTNAIRIIGLELPLPPGWQG